MPPRGRPTLVALSLVTPSSVASFSSSSSCGAAACRSLVLAASFAFRRNSRSEKERKKTDSPNEGWEETRSPGLEGEGKGLCVCACMCACVCVLFVLCVCASASSYLSSQSLADSRCNLHATSRSSHSRRSLPSLSFPPLSRHSLLPRPAPPPPAVPLFSRLLSPFGAAPPSLLHILAPRVYRAPLAQGPHF